MIELRGVGYNERSCDSISRMLRVMRTSSPLLSTAAWRPLLERICFTRGKWIMAERLTRANCRGYCAFNAPIVERSSTNVQDRVACVRLDPVDLVDCDNAGLVPAFRARLSAAVPPASQRREGIRLSTFFIGRNRLKGFEEYHLLLVSSVCRKVQHDPAQRCGHVDCR
jgi:hypothetical protein